MTEKKPPGEMSGVRVGIRVPPCVSTTELADFAADVERRGFDRLYVPDSQTLWRDAFLTLYAAALRTSTLGLSTAVSNVVTRHPSVVAGLVRSIDEVAPGRFTLGLGVGHSSIEPIGLRPSTGAELRAGVEQVRRLVRGEEVAYGPATARLRDPRTDGVPVQIAATGPKNLRLAGEIADGVIMLSGVGEAPLRRAIEHVHDGARAAGRDPEALQVTVSAHAMVTDDLERDARILKPVVATLASRGGRNALLAAGIDVEAPAEVPEVSPDLIHAEDWDLAVEVSSRWVTDADAVVFAREFCLFGTAEEIRDRLEVVRGVGVTDVFLQHVGSWDLPETLVSTVGARLLPLLQDG